MECYVEPYGDSRPFNAGRGAGILSAGLNMKLPSPSIVRRLILSFLGFGLAMGIVFPFYARFFVEWKPGMYGWFVVGCLIAGSTIGAVNYLLVRIILLGKLKQMSALTGAISRQDLTTRCVIVSQDVMGRMSQDFNSMIESLRTIVQDLDQESSGLRREIERLEHVCQTSVRDQNNQRQQLEQVASAMNQMSATAKEVERHADEAAAASETADREGNDAKVVIVEAMSVVDNLANQVEKSVEVMHRLKSESDNISQVLVVINDIAEQTNLLALNAAIEAARAGEQGRGFAVVADEVRNLATRTQASTREIREIIERLQNESVNAVDALQTGHEQALQGVEHTERAAEALAEISGAISSVLRMNTQIAHAAKEQNTVAESVNQNITAINQTAEGSAASSNEVLTSSRTLTTIASHLLDIIGRFRL